MNKIKNGKIHYAWLVMFACICIKTGSAAAVMCSLGNFVTPIVRELGCPVSAFTMVMSLEAISMALFYTKSAKVLSTKRIGLVMGIASVFEIGGMALMSLYQNVYMFYFSAVMIGIAQAFTGYVAIPIVINMWFRKKAGTVLGTVVAVGSVAGVVYNLMSAQLITGFGWRTAYLILSLIAAIVTLPAVFLIIKSPKEVGVQPYGAEDEQADAPQGEGLKDKVWGLTKKQAFSAVFLYLAWMACLCYSYGSGVSGYIANFSTMELGQSTNFGAYAGTAMSVGTIISSLVLGVLNDKFGVISGMLWGAVTNGIGYAVMFLSFQNPMFVLPAAFFVGLSASMYGVQCPLLARSIVGDKHYSDIWAIMMIPNSLIGGGLYFSIGLFYDKLGSYRGAFIMSICLHMAALLLGILAMKISRSKRNVIAA